MRPRGEHHCARLFVEWEIFDIYVAHAFVDDMRAPCLISIMSHFDMRCKSRSGFQAQAIISAVEKLKRTFSEKNGKETPPQIVSERDKHNRGRNTSVRLNVKTSLELIHFDFLCRAKE